MITRLDALQDVYNSLWNLSKTDRVKNDKGVYKGVCLSVSEVREMIEEERRRLSVYGQQNSLI